MLHTARLPEDILHNIYSYIPYEERALVSRENYSIYHTLFYEYDTYRTGDSYVRFLIRNDLSIPFKKVYCSNYSRWIKRKKYIYKNVIHKNYIEFIKFYTIENTSGKCMSFIHEQSFSKKQHKRSFLPNLNSKWTV